MTSSGGGGNDVDIKSKQTDRVPLLHGTDDATFERTCSRRCEIKCGFFLTWLVSFVPFLPSPYVSVPDGCKGIKYRGDRVVGVVGPGRHYCNPCTESISILQTGKVEAGHFETKSNRSSDGIDLDVDTLVTWNVSDVVTYVTRQTRGSETAVVGALTLEAVRQLIASQSADQFIVAGPEHSMQIRDALNIQLSAYGLTALTVALVDIDRSEKFKEQFLSKAARDEANAARLADAHTDAKVKALGVQVLVDQMKLLGPAGFAATMQVRAAEVMAASPNSKLLVYGGGGAGGAPTVQLVNA